VEALRMHHEERGARILEALAGTPEGSDAWSVANQLFGARLRTPEDRRFALVETLAHLEYLRGAGRATRDQHAVRVVYRAVST
jgi:hypothetical protein